MIRADGDLRRLFRAGLAPLGFELSAVESGGSVSGLPDLWWMRAGPPAAAGWCELKATGGWAVALRPHQVGWLVRAWAAGVRATVAVRARGLGSGGAARDALWLVPGSAAADLASGGLAAVRGRALGAWYGPPRAWPWGEVAAALCGPEGRRAD